MQDGIEISAGMDVSSSDGHSLGRVKELPHGSSFRVDCRLAPDYYVPISAVLRVEPGRVVLKFSKSQAAGLGWEIRPKDY